MEKGEILDENKKGERERKGLYVQSTQIGYIRTSKTWKKEREREKGALRPINANRLYTDE